MIIILMAAVVLIVRIATVVARKWTHTFLLRLCLLWTVGVGHCDTQEWMNEVDMNYREIVVRENVPIAASIVLCWVALGCVAGFGRIRKARFSSTDWVPGWLYSSRCWYSLGWVWFQLVWAGSVGKESLKNKRLKRCWRKEHGRKDAPSRDEKRDPKVMLNLS